MTGILFDKKIPKRMKSETYKRMIRPAMTHGNECLTVKQKENDKFEVTEMKMLRRIEGITRLDRRRNEDVRRALDVEPINEFIRANRLRWFDHVYRRGENNILRKIYSFEQHGRRNRGRPKTTWKSVIEEDIREFTIYNVAQDGDPRRPVNEHSRTVSRTSVTKTVQGR